MRTLPFSTPWVINQSFYSCWHVKTLLFLGTLWALLTFILPSLELPVLRNSVSGTLGFRCDLKANDAAIFPLNFQEVRGKVLRSDVGCPALLMETLPFAECVHIMWFAEIKGALNSTGFSSSSELCRNCDLSGRGSQNPAPPNPEHLYTGGFPTASWAVSALHTPQPCTCIIQDYSSSWWSHCLQVGGELSFWICKGFLRAQILKFK